MGKILARDGEQTEKEKWIELVQEIACSSSVKRPKEVLPTCVTLSKAPNRNQGAEREAAAAALSEFIRHSEEEPTLLEQMVEELCQHVSDDSPTVRSLCLRGLVQIPEGHMRKYIQQVLGVILALLEDANESVQLTAVQCLLTVLNLSEQDAIEPILISLLIRLRNLQVQLVLHPGIQDQFRWKLTQSGKYSSKSAYDTFFVGSIRFAPWKRIWKSWAPLHCKFFIWLAINNRCWTADHLAKRGLPHPSLCPLCDQFDESIQHLLVACVFTRQVWAAILPQLGLTMYTAYINSDHLATWWRKLTSSAHKDRRRGFNSLIILVSWEIWKHRNSCIFEGSTPNIGLVLQSVGSECSLWCKAGASKLLELLAQPIISTF